MQENGATDIRVRVTPRKNLFKKFSGKNPGREYLLEEISYLLFMQMRVCIVRGVWRHSYCS